MKLSPYGPRSRRRRRRTIAKAQKKILGGWSPFTGPVYDQKGKVQVAKGKAATAKQISTMSYLVKGVVGNIPK